MDGILVIHKEQNYTSQDVVAKLRGICGQRKIGHTGTLDPNATGVLPICLGKATKLVELLTDGTKEYVADFLLGKTTDTQDIWGKITGDTKEEWKKFSEMQVKEAILQFLGTYEQIPPMYSAKKINGKKLYELAREGKEVERRSVSVMISELEILSMELPKVKIRVVCSKGTYVRTLCHDIGKRLGCGAVMTSLVRTRVGNFSLEDAHFLGEIQEWKNEGKLEENLLSPEICFCSYPQITVSDIYEKKLFNGNSLPMKLITSEMGGERFRIYDSGGRFCAVYRMERKENRLMPWKIFI